MTPLTGSGPAPSPGLDLRRARLVALMGAIVAFDAEGLEALRRAAPAGEPDRAWREVALQAHLFCGFPRTLAALEVLARAGGLGPVPLDEPLGREPATTTEPRGAALFDRIYAEASGPVRASLAAYHPDLAHWIADHAYGRVLSRPGLDAGTRELCAVAALAITGHERQLAGHARGAVRCGASAADVAATLTLVERWIPPAYRARAHDVAAQFAR